MLFVRIANGQALAYLHLLRLVKRVHLVLRGDHTARCRLTRRLCSYLLSMLCLIATAHVDDRAVYTIRRVLLRVAGPVSTLRDGNSTLLVRVRRRDAAHLDLAVSTSRSLQLLRQRTSCLTILLCLRSLLLLVQLNLLFVQLLAGSQVKVVNYVRYVGHAVAWL